MWLKLVVRAWAEGIFSMKLKKLWGWAVVMQFCGRSLG